MSGDPANANLWTDADVYVAATDATDPADADTEFGADWDLCGLLDGDFGFPQTRNEEETDIYAWGGIIVRTSRRNFKQTVGFTLLEDNDTTRSLIWPGSSGDYLVVPRPERIKIAFETREGDTTRRLISAYEAEVKVNADIVDNESDLTRYQMLATIFPDTSVSPGRLFKEQSTDATSS